jgi:hypothetical protein
VFQRRLLYRVVHNHSLSLQSERQACISICDGVRSFLLEVAEHPRWDVGLLLRLRSSILEIHLFGEECVDWCFAIPSITVTTETDTAERWVSVAEFLEDH